MKNLFELKDKLRNELDDEYEDSPVEDDEIDDLGPQDDMEDEDEDEKDDDDDLEVDKNSMSYIRIDTQDRVKGRISKLDFELNYKELSDRINDEVPGVILTKIKARQVVDVIRKEMGF